MARSRILLCALMLVCAPLLFVTSLRAQQRTPASGKQPLQPLTVTVPSQPLVDLGGMWQFHPGDDPRWAAPRYDDSAWAAISTDKGWDVQGYSYIGGFGWYRRHLHYASPAAAAIPLALMPLQIAGTDEVFWNGVRIGECGRFPPHDRIRSCWDPIELPPGAGGTDGVLAIRVWTFPGYRLLPDGELGLSAMPQLGSLQAVEAATGEGLYRFWRGMRIANVLAILYAVACIMAFVAFWLDRREPLYLWLGLFLLMAAFRFGIELWVDFGNLSWELFEPLLYMIGYGLEFGYLWLLLLRLFSLNEERRWRQATLALIYVHLASCVFCYLPILKLSSWTPTTALFFRVSWWAETLMELYTVVLIAAGLRRRLNRAGWAVGITATLVVLPPVIYNIFQLFHRWDLGARYFLAPLFTLLGGRVTVIEISQFLLLAALGYAAVERLLRSRRQRTETELELRSAQEVQFILVPEAMPAIPGFVLASAYRPAQEVGGDFFQVIPLRDESTLVLIGDVSGKGLRAGMMVALIIGAARTAAESDPDPAAVLGSVNRRLSGRMQGGFATSLAVRVHPDGRCTVANAGHLAPVLNGEEMETPGALPLGLDPDATYDAVPFRLHDGDTLTLYTDGVPEARNKRGELFGFERTALLVANSQGAEAIAEQAQVFGQEDDITVLTIKRVPWMSLGVATDLAGVAAG